MAAAADIFFEHSEWRKPLTWSALLHVTVAGAILAYSVVHSGPTEMWGGGGGGDAMGVSLVSNIPLPSNNAPTQNVLASESKGITKSQPKPEVTDQNAIPIADKTSKRKPKKTTTETQKKPEPEEEASNVVPFGEGGPVSGPYGMFSAGGAKGGFGFTGGGGDFGNKYAWYVQTVQRKVSQNWLQYEIDPRIANANRVYIKFDILRDGRPTDIELEQSSGIPSLDISAKRAIQRIDTFGPLPADYSGSKVTVEFWFDYKR
jgi:protein TonB